MTTIQEHLDALSREDSEALVEALNTWKTAGVENPLIPLDFDIDGDGHTDAYALDSDGKLTVVTVLIDQTVAEAVGGGVEAEEV